MFKFDISKYVIMTVTMAVIVVTTVRVWQVMVKKHDCEMTWMFERANFTRILLPSDVQELYPTYGLYFYGEGLYAQVYRQVPLQGIPVLFIPGNRGSHKQVRSAGSIALRMAGKEFPHHNHFNFFTVDLNEEFSGVFGGTLWQQTKYVQYCISHILSLYSHLPHPPTTVTILAHSMGGVVARALFSLDTFNVSLVNLIITMATPHARPVAYSDILLCSFYQSVEETWSSSRVDHVTLVSIAAGEKDIQVARHLTLPKVYTGHGQILTYLTRSVPRHWKSSDHQAIVWCRRLQLSLGRILFNLQQNNSFDLDTSKYRTMFDRWLYTPSAEDKISIDKIPHITVDLRWTWLIQNDCNLNVFFNILETDKVTNNESFEGVNFVGYALSKWSHKWDVVTIASNMGTDQWIILCQIKSGDKILSNCLDASRRSLQLPPVYGTTMILSLPLATYKNYTIFVQKPRALRAPLKKKTNLIKPYSFVNFHNQSLEVLSMPNVFSGSSVVKLVVRCPLTFLSLEATNSLQGWSKVYRVTVTFYGDGPGPHVPSVGAYADGISQGFHSISGYFPLTVKFDMTLETQCQELYLLMWSMQASRIQVHVEYDLVGVISKVLCDCLLDIIWWCMVASVIRSTMLCFCSHTLVVPLIFLSVNYPVVLSSVTGSVITNVVPFPASGVALIASLTVLITGVNGIVEIFIRLLIMLAHRLIHRHNYCLLVLGRLAFVACIFTCGSLSILIIFIHSICKGMPRNAVFLVPLFWIQVVTSPALLAWIHALTYKMFLSPDPHFAFSLLASTLYNLKYM